MSTVAHVAQPLPPSPTRHSAGRRAHESTPQARSRALKVITAERDALAAIVLKIWGIRDASLDGRLEPGQAVAQLDDVISSWLEDAWPMATITQLRTSHAHPTTDTPPDP